MRKALSIFGVLCLLGLQGETVCADGKYYPERAYKKPPAIPSQRAILVYKDGVEKLVVESALDGEGKEFGWIIPVPSKPSEFAKASPGFLKTLSLSIQPKITHDLTRVLVPVYIIAAGITLCYLVLLAGAPRIAEFLVVFSIALVLLSTLMPTLNSSSNAEVAREGTLVSIPGVRVQEVRQIGSYQLAVLEADAAEALDEWLESNGFLGLSVKDRAIVADYIRHKWFFVAAELRREAGGYSRPHPLAMTFQSKIPVYPMRLTSTTGSDVYLELFIISDKRAENSRLRLEVSDKFHFKEKLRRGRFRSERMGPGFTGKVHHQMVGHPEAARYMWEGCILTKLCGTLRPEEMSEDIAIELTGTEPYRRHYFSRRGAKGTALILGVNAWWILLIALTVLQRKKIPRTKPGRFVFFKAMIPSATIALALWVTTFSVLPKIEVKTKSELVKDGIYWLGHYWRPVAKEAIARGFNDFKGMTRDEVAAEVEDLLRFLIYRSHITGERIKHEDSPGNYTISTSEDGIILRTYSRDGFPDDFLLKAGAHPHMFREEEGRVNRCLQEFAGPDSQKSAMQVLEEMLHSSQFGRVYVLVSFYKNRPRCLVPVILEDLQRQHKDLKGRSDYDYAYDYYYHLREIDYEVAMLGCIARIEPPEDVADKVKTQEFIARIEQWYKSTQPTGQ